MRKLFCFLCVLLLGFGMLGAASAMPIPYCVNGTFEDGGNFSGTFVYDSSISDLSYSMISTTAGSMITSESDYPLVGVWGIDTVGIGGESGLIGFRGLGSNGYALFMEFDDPLWTGNTTTSVATTSLESAYDVIRRNVESGSAAAVPEPTTMLLLGAGLVGLAGFGRKKFKR